MSTPAAADELRPSPSTVDKARLRLDAVLGDHQVLSDRDLLDAYASDESFCGRYRPDLVVRAHSAADVAKVFAVATDLRVPVVPRGLGTGKSGGALAVHGGIVLAMERMNRVLEVGKADLLAVAEPGVITADFMAAVEAEGLFYPPDPNSLESCSLGGNVACNAGGPRAFKYGVTRNYVLALEVVLATGQLLELGTRTIKGVVGYDLVSMMVGSEGTLGVITRVTARLIPLPSAVQTALVTFADLGTASAGITKILASGVVPRTLELLDIHALNAVRDATPGRFPEDAGAMLILETDGASDARAMEDLERAAQACLDEKAIDVLVAQDSAQRDKIWAPRRVLSATLAETSPRKISEDIVVPRSRIPEMLDRVQRIADRRGVRVASYGHAGDGNLHVNVLFDDETEDAAEDAVRDLMSATIELSGTISGEHGVGLTKRDFVPLEQPSPLIAMQQQLKSTFDPVGILNPGKIFPSRGCSE